MGMSGDDYSHFRFQFLKKRCHGKLVTRGVARSKKWGGQYGWGVERGVPPKSR